MVLHVVTVPLPTVIATGTGVANANANGGARRPAAVLVIYLRLGDVKGVRGSSYGTLTWTRHPKTTW